MRVCAIRKASMQEMTSAMVDDGSNLAGDESVVYDENMMFSMPSESYGLGGSREGNLK